MTIKSVWKTTLSPLLLDHTCDVHYLTWFHGFINCVGSSELSLDYLYLQGYNLSYTMTLCDWSHCFSSVQTFQKACRKLTGQALHDITFAVWRAKNLGFFINLWVHIEQWGQLVELSRHKVLECDKCWWYSSGLDMRGAVVCGTLYCPTDSIPTLLKYIISHIHVVSRC